MEDKGFYFGGMEMCGDRIDTVVAQRCECVQTGDFRFCEFYFSTFLNKEGSVGKEIMSTTTGLVHHHSGHLEAEAMASLSLKASTPAASLGRLLGHQRASV